MVRLTTMVELAQAHYSMQQAVVCPTQMQYVLVATAVREANV